MTLRHRTEQRYRNSVRAVEIRKISIPQYPVSRSFGCHNENWRLQGANFGHQLFNAKFELTMIVSPTTTPAMSPVSIPASDFDAYRIEARPVASKCGNGVQRNDDRSHVNAFL